MRVDATFETGPKRRSRARARSLSLSLSLALSHLFFLSIILSLPFLSSHRTGEVGAGLVGQGLPPGAERGRGGVEALLEREDWVAAAGRRAAPQHVPEDVNRAQVKRRELAIPSDRKHQPACTVMKWSITPGCMHAEMVQ